MSPANIIRNQGKFAGPLSEDWPFPLCLVSDHNQGSDGSESPKGFEGTEASERRSKILWANQALQEWCGIALKQLTGLALADVFEFNEDVAQMCRDCAATQAPITMHDCEIGVNGQALPRPCQLTAYPSADGIGLSIIFTRVQNTHNIMGGQMVTGMGRMIAHELKNPLAGIKGAAQLLRDDVSSDEAYGLIDLIGSEIDRVRRLLDRMETLGHDPMDMTEPINVHEILRQARRIIQSANRDVIFTEHYDPSLPEAIGHKDSLMQAILNLIKNASEAVAAGGEILLETSSRMGVKGRGHNGEDKRHLPIEIRIIDNGPGINEAQYGHIFQPFVSTKTGGQGLGLALVAKVIQSHGGLIELRSRPGRTVFSILLPLPQDKMPNDATVKPTVQK